MLKLCAQFADRWNSFGSVEEIRSRNSVLDEKCAEVGRDPDDIVRSLYLWAAHAENDQWSSLDAFQDVIGRYREAGINEFIIDQPRDDQMAFMERVAVEVIPALRS
jgi:alkanesulfonate monooxygenase SsuD/methylene tetrahydromethanopterin reductase-like flavin-dependent oxidoreductase (luciferase family)